MHSIFTLSVAAFAGFCAAQSTSQNDYPYTIDPSTVTEDLRREYNHITQLRTHHPNSMQSTGVTRTRPSARSSASSNPASPH